MSDGWLDPCSLWFRCVPPPSRTSQSSCFLITSSFLSILHLFVNPLSSRAGRGEVRRRRRRDSGFCPFFVLPPNKSLRPPPRAAVKLRQTLHFLWFRLYVGAAVLHVQMSHSSRGQDWIYSIMKAIKYQTCSCSYLNVTKVLWSQQKPQIPSHQWILQTQAPPIVVCHGGF